MKNLILFIILLCVGCAQPSYLIDTGFEVSWNRGSYHVGAWLDNDRVLINVLQQGEEARKKWRVNTVLFNVKTREQKIVALNTYVKCFIPELRVLNIKDVSNYDENTNFLIKIPDRLMGVDANGLLSDVSLPPGVNGSCYPNKEHLKDRLTYSLGRDGDYIDKGKIGGSELDKPATLYMKNKPPLVLPFSGGEIANVKYFPSLDAYAIRSGLSKVSKNQVIFLIKAGGGLFEINQPSISVVRTAFPQFDGYKDRFVGHYVRDGFLFLSSGDFAENPGVFLLKEDRMIKLATWQFIEGDYILSPDGCTLGFSAANSMNAAVAKKIYFINTCEVK